MGTRIFRVRDTTVALFLSKDEARALLERLGYHTGIRESKVFLRAKVKLDIAVNSKRLSNFGAEAD